MGEHGMGTVVRIEEMRKDGTKRIRYRVAVPVGGRRVWRTAKTPKAADKIRSDLIEAALLDLDPTRQTVAGYLRSWIANQRETKHRRIRERTLIGYERLIEQRIVPTLGDIALARLSKRRVQAWIDQQDGSPQTVRNAHAVLRKALHAVAGDVIPINPALGVELPERKPFHGQPLTADEAKRLLEATEGSRLHAFWRLAIVTGLRSGELLGLSRDSLEVRHAHEQTTRGTRGAGDDLRPAGLGVRDAASGQPDGRRAGGDRAGTLVLDGRLPAGYGEPRLAGYLRVDAQLQRIGGRWVLGPTKAARSLTRIALDPTTVAVVEKHLRDRAVERKPGWRYHGLMFVTERGEPYHEATILTEFRRACEAAGISARRVHDLRVSSATILRDLGIDKDTRKARLGHSTDRMADHYAQASARLDEDAVERLAEAIG